MNFLEDLYKIQRNPEAANKLFNPNELLALKIQFENLGFEFKGAKVIPASVDYDRFHGLNMTLIAEQVIQALLEEGTVVRTEEDIHIDMSEIKRDVDKLRILIGLGFVELLQEQFEKINGDRNTTAVARIIIKMGLTDSKDSKSISSALRKLLTDEIDLNQDYIDAQLRNMKLL